MRPWSDDIFGEVPSSFEDRVQATLRDLEEPVMKHENHYKTRKSMKKGLTALIAAVLVLALCGAGYAAVSHIQFVESEVSTIYEGSEETVTERMVEFTAVDDSPINMGVWELSAVPEGFEEVDSDYRDGYAGVSWENGKGDHLGFVYQAADLAYGQMMLTDISEEKDVAVNGTAGKLYVTTNFEGEKNTQVFWMNEEKGVGFILSYSGENAIDLVSLAESVVPTEGHPKMSEEAKQAVAALGDWAPDALPEGYVEYVTTGMPPEYGGETGYAYVHRTYVNDAGAAIQIDYEVVVGENITYNNYVNYWRDLPAELGGGLVKDLSIQGQPAGLVEKTEGVPERLVWLSEDGSLVFILEAETLTSEELMAVAESVTLR